MEKRQKFQLFNLIQKIKRIASMCAKQLQEDMMKTGTCVLVATIRRALNIEGLQHP